MNEVRSRNGMSFVLALVFVLIGIKSFAQLNPDTLRIDMKTTSGMQYDLVRFSVKPGGYVKLVLTNQDDMEHNLVIGKKESRQRIVDAALALGKDGPSVGYIPKMDAVLWSIHLLHIGQIDSILFRAPRSTGVYPYVCTFPGHGGIMYGAMHVTNGVMPELNADLDVPPHRRKSEQASTQDRPSGHPYTLVAPYLYRVLMPDAGPAAIAVCLPNKINYCWDAGLCRLRYAWQGEFLDLTDYWTIKGEVHAKILGTIFYKDRTDFPFYVSKSAASPPIVKFKGYRMVKNYPEFHYMINEVEVFELIRSTIDGAGLERQFRMIGVDRSLLFTHEADDGIVYKSDKGHWKGNQLELEPVEASSFIIMMTKSN